MTILERDDMAQRAAIVAVLLETVCLRQSHKALLDVTHMQDEEEVAASP